MNSFNYMLGLLGYVCEIQALLLLKAKLFASSPSILIIYKAWTTHDQEKPLLDISTNWCGARREGKIAD